MMFLHEWMISLDNVFSPLENTKEIHASTVVNLIFRHGKKVQKSRV